MKGGVAPITTSTPIGMRDLAVIGTLIFTGARAVAPLRAKDFQDSGTQHVLRFDEKGTTVFQRIEDDEKDDLIVSR